MGVLYRWTGGLEPAFKVMNTVLVLRALAELGLGPQALDDAGQVAAAKLGAADPDLQHWLGIGVWPDHPTHWLAFWQFSGFSNPADNGWVLYGYRKARYSQQQAEAEIKAAARRIGVREVVVRWFNPDGTQSAAE